MDNSVVKYSMEDFLHTTLPYEYLVSIQNPMERDHEIAAYKKFALKSCGISAVTFKQALRQASAKLEDEKAKDASAPMTQFSGLPEGVRNLRCPGYYCTDGGIWRDSAFGPSLVLAHPILPIARIANYDTGERKTLIAFRTGRHWQQHVVSREVLSSRVKIVQQLSSVGAYVTSENCPGVISYLADIENANIDLLPTEHSAGRMGWVADGKFLPYETGLIFDGDVKYGEMYKAISEHGDRDVWYRLARDVRSSDSIAARVMLAASFASVLIRPLKALPFFVHCWSDVSGSGKTVALMLAASVWADPNEGAYVRNMNTTNVGVEMTAGFLGSLPLCLDEMCLKDKRDGLEELVYSFCEGVGRARGSRTGGIQRQQRWYNCAITTGETPIVSDNSRAGSVNRVLDLEVSGALFDDPVDVANTVRANYGFAGHEFVNALLKDGAMDEVRRVQGEVMGELAACNATSKQTLMMSVILTADRFATEHVFKDGRALTVQDIAPLLKADSDVDTNLRAYEWLMGTIAEHNARFEPTDEHYTGVIWGKLDEQAGSETVCCIIASVFRTLLTEQGFNDRSFLKWAKRVGVLEQDGEGKNSRLVRLSSFGSTPTRCICIKMNALNKKSAPDGYSKAELSDEDVPW